MDIQRRDERKWFRPPRIQLLAAGILIATTVVHLAAQDWFFAAVTTVLAVFMLWVAYVKRDY